MARTRPQRSSSPAVGQRRSSRPRKTRVVLSPSPPHKAPRSAKKGMARASKTSKKATTKKVGKDPKMRAAVLAIYDRFSWTSEKMKDQVLTAKDALVEQNVLVKTGSSGTTMIALGEDVAEEIAEYKKKKMADSDDDEDAAFAYLSQSSPGKSSPTTRKRSSSSTKKRVSTTAATTSASKSKSKKRVSIVAPDDAEDEEEEGEEEEEEEDDNLSKKRKPRVNKKKTKRTKVVRVSGASASASGDGDNEGEEVDELEEDGENAEEEEDEPPQKKRRKAAAAGQKRNNGARGGLTNLRKPELMELVKKLRVEVEELKTNEGDGTDDEGDDEEEDGADTSSSSVKGKGKEKATDELEDEGSAPGHTAEDDEELVRDVQEWEQKAKQYKKLLSQYEVVSDDENVPSRRGQGQAQQEHVVDEEEEEEEDYGGGMDQPFLDDFGSDGSFTAGDGFDDGVFAQGSSTTAEAVKSSSPKANGTSQHEKKDSFWVDPGRLPRFANQPRQQHRVETSTSSAAFSADYPRLDLDGDVPDTRPNLSLDVSGEASHKRSLVNKGSGLPSPAHSGGHVFSSSPADQQLNNFSRSAAGQAENPGRFPSPGFSSSPTKSQPGPSQSEEHGVHDDGEFSRQATTEPSSPVFPFPSSGFPASTRDGKGAVAEEQLKESNAALEAALEKIAEISKERDDEKRVKEGYKEELEVVARRHQDIVDALENYTASTVDVIFRDVAQKAALQGAARAVERAARKTEKKELELREAQAKRDQSEKDYEALLASEADGEARRVAAGRENAQLKAEVAQFKLEAEKREDDIKAAKERAEKAEVMRRETEKEFQEFKAAHNGCEADLEGNLAILDQLDALQRELSNEQTRRAAAEEAQKTTVDELLAERKRAQADQQTISLLTSEVADYKTQREESKAEAERYRVEVEMRTSEIEQLNASLTASLAALETARSTETNPRKDLAVQTDHMAELEAQVEQRKKGQDLVSKELEELKASYAVLTSRCQDLATAFELTPPSSGTPLSPAGILDTLSARLHARDETEARLTTELEEKKEELEAKAKELEELKSKATEFEREVDRLVKELGENRSSYEELQSTKKELENDHAALQASLDTFTTEHAALRAQHTELEAEHGELQKRLADVEPKYRRISQIITGEPNVDDYDGKAGQAGEKATEGGEPEVVEVE
ncbi:hypothetical protein JCM8547_007578 [Rhodosporidiobolus lusitaniae]